MARRLDPASVAKKWQTNTGNAVEAMKTGVNSVTVNPAQQAADSADLWQQRVSSSDAKAKFQANLSSVSLQDWKNAMIKKGADNMSTGVREAGAKMQRFLTAFLPVAYASADAISNMPKGTEQNSIDRMVANMRNMKAFKRS